MQNIGATAVAQPEEIRERRTAAEDFKGGIDADLGAPGTYGPAATNPIPPTAQPNPNAPTAPPNTTAPSSLLSKDGFSFSNKNVVKKYDSLIKKGYSSDDIQKIIGGDQMQSEDSIFSQTKTGVGSAGYAGGKIGQTTTELNKDKAKAQVEGSSAFRQVSQMMAESEQLLSRSGPLYDEMIQSTQLPIIEGAAAAARENTENLRQAMARGGSARRDAFEAIGKIRAQDQINVQKGQALAQAHMNLDMWARDNAKNVINFAQGWSSNLAGVREQYQSAMDNAAALMDSKALPIMFDTANKAQEYREAQSAQSRGKVNRWITGVLGLAEGVMTAYRGGDASGVNAQFNNIGGAVVSSAQSAGSGMMSAGKGVYDSIFGGGNQPSNGGSGDANLDAGTGPASNNYYSSTD